MIWQHLNHPNQNNKNKFWRKLSKYFAKVDIFQFFLS